MVTKKKTNLVEMTLMQFEINLLTSIFKELHFKSENKKLLLDLITGKQVKLYYENKKLAEELIKLMPKNKKRKNEKNKS